MDNLKTNWLSKTVFNLHRVGSRLSNEKSSAAKARGVDVLKLSGTPTTPPGENVIEAARSAACENRHAPSRGIFELREAVSKKLQSENKVIVNPGDEILITNGAQQALYISLLGLVDKDDEVLIPTPAYFTDGIVNLVGGRPVFAKMKLDEGFRLNPSIIEESLTSKTKILLLTNPVNPTGHVANRDDLFAITQLVEKNNLLVISDESYEKIIFDGREHISFASLDGMAERTLTIHSFSKSYAMAGWRVGYIFGPSFIISQLAKVTEWMQLHGNYICQKAAAAAISGPQDWVNKIRVDVERNRDVLTEGLSEVNTISFVKPCGSPNIFPNIKGLNIEEEVFSDFLLDSFGIRTEPGQAFNYRGHFRIQFFGQEDTIKELNNRLKKAVEVISST